MMQRPDQERISFEEFRRIIARELQIDESQVVGDASFVEDLMADSIKLVEMMLRMEEIGIDIPLESAWEVQTVGDAYRVYSEHASSQA
jgi:acyl carrier protein